MQHPHQHAMQFGGTANAAIGSARAFVAAAGTQPHTTQPQPPPAQPTPPAQTRRASFQAYSPHAIPQHPHSQHPLTPGGSVVGGGAADRSFYPRVPVPRTPPFSPSMPFAHQQHHQPQQQLYFTTGPLQLSPSPPLVTSPGAYSTHSGGGGNPHPHPGTTGHAAHIASIQAHGVPPPPGGQKKHEQSAVQWACSSFRAQAASCSSRPHPLTRFLWCLFLV